jgi:hypothetical protein
VRGAEAAIPVLNNPYIGAKAAGKEGAMEMQGSAGPLAHNQFLRHQRQTQQIQKQIYQH